MKILLILIMLLALWFVLALIINHEAWLVLLDSLLNGYNFCAFHPLDLWCAPRNIILGMMP